MVFQQAYGISEQPFKIELKNIQPGTYGLRFYHDENENGKLDANRFGIPSENYGFSNNATGVMGPPKYKNTLFELDKDMTLNLIAR